jgi:membrane-associated phospholipid phosphatase
VKETTATKPKSPGVEPSSGAPGAVATAEREEATRPVPPVAGPPAAGGRPPPPRHGRGPRRRRLRRPVSYRRLLLLRPTPSIPVLSWPPSRRTIVRVGLALAIVAASVLTNRTFLGWGLFATVAVLIVPVGRARSFLLSFVPYAGVWFIFSALRSLADETVLAETLNTNVWRFERWLFGGTLPTITLQDRYLDVTNLRFHDYFLTGVHWSYFVVPHAVAAWSWHRNPRLFRHYLGAMTLLLAVGLCIYFLLPSNPPWLSPDPVNSPAAVQVERVMEPVGKEIGGGIYSASYKVIGESNPIAAMPSIHMAITFLLVFVARPAGGRWFGLAMLYSFLMGLALVYLGEHYVVDVAVGMLIAAYGWFAAGTWLGRVAPVLAGRFSRPAAVRAPEGVGA